MKQVSLTIDGKQVTVPEGTLVVDAAKKIGIDVPVFCYHPKLEPVGMCRMCLVEIGRPVVDRATGQPVMDEAGKPKLQFLPKLETACTNPVSEGMAVLTQSAKAMEGQKATTEFLLTSHPLDCPICDKGGECPLQNLTMAHGASESRFLYDEKMHLAKSKPLGELIYLDEERCIQCGRCIRFQSDVAGDAVLGFDQRGRSMHIITTSEPGFDSVFSGNTTDICPVGALTTADFRFGARAWEMHETASICAQCPVGCNTTLNTRRDAREGKIVVKRVMPRQNEEVNELWICDKGRFVHHAGESSARLHQPMVRKGGALAADSWESAIRASADGLSKAGKQLLVVASGKLANEDLHNLKRLADGVGGKMGLYSSMGGGAMTGAYGLQAGSNLGAMGTGSTIVVAASDLYEEAPIWYLRVKQAAQRGATLIVVNPRETRLDRYAAFVVRYAYGDEVETIRSLTGNTKVAEAFTKAENAIILFGSDGLGLQGSTAVASACAAALHQTSHFGRPNNGLIGVWQHANDQGAAELGIEPIADLQSAFDQAQAVYFVGVDPIGNGTIKPGKNEPFIIAQDIFENATVQSADVVFPSQTHMEREGTFTSGERRVQRFYAAVPAVAGTRPDFAITAAVATSMGIKLEAADARSAFAFMAAAGGVWAGMSYDRLAEVHEQWPIAGRADLYYGGTAYDNKGGLGIHLGSRGKPAEPKAESASKLSPREAQLLAVPVTKLYDRARSLVATPLLAQRIGEPFVTLHPETAAKNGIAAGASALVEVDGIETALQVRLDSSISTGVALIARSMGVRINEPVSIRIRSAQKATR